MTAPFTVVIPAHDEAAVIGRCLAKMRDGAAPGVMEVIVVCNGCGDDTAETARRAAPDALVMELAEGSKTGAINAGIASASHRPIIVVDADIAVDHAALAATAQALRDPGAMAAAPSLRIDTSACSAPVRAYYRVWASQPYVTGNMVGSGLYGLSEAALAVIGTFPPIIADDEFVRTRFPEAALRKVRDASFTMFPPRDIASLIRIESRQRAGLDQLRRLHPAPGRTGARLTGWRTLRDAGAGPVGLFVYLGVKLAGRLHFRWSRLRGRERRWLRDESSRRGSDA